MKKKSSIIIVAVLTLVFVSVILITTKVHAAPETIPIPKIGISVDNATTPQQYVGNIKLLIMLTIISLLPSFIMMMTSFVRIIVVFGFLRTALGTQQAPPNTVLIGLALFLTVFIMSPVYTKINTNALQPYMENKITQEVAIEEAAKPLRQFMLKQTRQKDFQLFIDMANLDYKVTKDNAPLNVVVPAYIISELKTAFQIGFLIFIPFLIIDLVVGSILMSMGMFMLPPVMVSLPFKLLLFVMVDGWYLMIKSLIMSFA